MDKNKVNITNIEAYLYGVMGDVVSENTFVGTLPDIVNSEWQDMCLIDCSNQISDKNAYGSGVVRIYLYARPKPNGAKNISVLGMMERKVNEVLENARNNGYVLNRKGAYTDYDNAIKWHCNIVELNLSVF